MNGWSVEGLVSQVDGFRLGPVDLELAPGRVVAVLGSSGAGKTTLLRTLAGFLPARAGRIVRDGVDLTDRPPEERGLGYVPQGLGLFPHRTVERNVSYPLEVRGRTDALARSRALLARFGLTELAHRHPARLSGGELERVALARALAGEPDLVLWDEPWQALDVEARHELGRVLEELRETDRVPVVVVTHDPSLAFSVADSFLVLRAGKVGLRGDAATLLAHPSDAFTARFVGFENVYDRTALERGRPGSLASWLSGRAGTDGVAFARPAPRAGGDPDGAWDGVVRSARPTPEGLAVTVRVDDLSVALRLPPPPLGAVPSVGSRVRFDIEEKSVHALGPAVPGPRGPPE
ncbi:MAG TPA: ABC transporter ATP-binding protein [Thermoplasmata archaeon]|jgi:ABC-type Fe3+/spermidine/putrescine transport system ATPase subunit